MGEVYPSNGASLLLNLGASEDAKRPRVAPSLKAGVEPAKRVAGVVWERWGAIGVEAAEKRPLEGMLLAGGAKGAGFGSEGRRKRGGLGGGIVGDGGEGREMGDEDGRWRLRWTRWW